MNAPLLVPVFADARLRAYPKHAHGGRAMYMTAEEALTRAFDTDAHFAAYSAPSLARRLSLDLLRLPDTRARLPEGVVMGLAVFDVDCPEAHGSSAEASDAWWIGELEKLERLGAKHPGAFLYRTRGGYRIVYALPTPYVLREDADAEAWSHRYVGWVDYMRREFGIEADPACRDWTRLFRLPRATRAGGEKPESRETIGRPGGLGSWTPEPSAPALDETATTRAPRGKTGRPRRTRSAAIRTGEGILHHLFRSRGWLGREIEPGTHLAVCPNEGQHTAGEALDGSTVLFAPAEGEAYGHLYCHHAHCQGRTLRDALRGFPPEEIAAARAAVAAGDEESQGRAGGDERPAVLVPGTHATQDGETEIGSDRFTEAVLVAIPPDALCRMDFVVGQVAGPRGERRFIPLDEASMRLLVDRHVRLVRHVTDSRDGRARTCFVPCTRDHAGLVLAAAATSARVQCLVQLVHHPVYLPGFELARPGWNPASGVYYDEPPALETLDVLRDLLVDWPFVDEASLHNAFGLMLTAVLRPAIEGAIPFHYVLASLERTGKGKLIDTALGHAVLGDAVDPVQAGTDEAEREKRIVSILLRGAPAAHFDNVPGTVLLDSPVLASLATAYPHFVSRMLGTNRAPRLPNRAVWVFSANNLTATGEIVKRGVPIFLQPRDDHPELRTDFLHPDCVAFARERRRSVLEALLGIVEGWKAAGRPLPPGVAMGGFERWVAGVGGCLRHAGAVGWMANYTAWISSADNTQADAKKLVKAWSEAYGTKVVTAGQLLPLVEATGAFRWVLSRPTREGCIVSFGRKVLAVLDGRPVGTWIVRRETSGSSATYRLERAMPGSDPPDPSDATNGAASRPTSPSSLSSERDGARDSIAASEPACEEVYV